MAWDRTAGDAGILAAAPPAGGFDLLRVRAVRALLRWHGFPYVFQALLLLVFVPLVLWGWNVHAPAGVDKKLFAKSNLVTLLIWGLWWPAMVWLAVLFGRAWCMVCPLELVSNGSERLARELGLRPRVLNPTLAAGGLIFVLYALLQLLVDTAQLHRTPAYTAWFLAALPALAAVTALRWKDRAFCRGFCPVGLLLGTYGRGGMLAVRAGPAAVCRDCPDRACTVERNRTRLDARSCPSLLNPPRLNSNRDCLVCGQCFKACEPGNLRLLVRPLFSRSDRREPMASWPVTLFVILVSGFVTWELFTEWKKAEAVFLAPAQWFITTFHAGAVMAGLVKWAWALVLVPGVAWLALAGLSRLLGDRRPTGERLRGLALPMAVVVAAGHMAKGLAKFVSWAPFLPGALHDPAGVETARAIAAKTQAFPASWLATTSVSLISAALVVAAFVFSVREHRLARAEGSSHVSAVLPLAIVAVTFFGIIAGWVVG